MQYPHARENETPNLLARITMQQAAKLHEPQPATEGPVTTRKAVAMPKKEAREQASPKKEPNTTIVKNSDGTTSYRVQIRGRVNGKLHSITKSFSSPVLARAWRKRTQAEIELNGFPIPGKKLAVPTVSELLKSRLDKDTYLGRSAKQQLQFLSKQDFWKEKLISELTQADIVCFAEKMITEKRLPQTVAGYMTMLAKTLKRASMRELPVAPDAVERGMAILWDEKILARSTKRDRRPTLFELDRVLT